MTAWKLVTRSLIHYRRTHVGTFLGAALAAAILTGALGVGDSVRYSLREMALARLGGIHHALNAGTRFFRADLADMVREDLRAPTASVMLLRGAVSTETSRAGNVQVVGIDEEFHRFAPRSPSWDQSGAALNDRLARRLGVKTGDEVVVRVERPSSLSRDAPLSTIEDSTIALRLTVSAVVGAESLGGFGLDANGTSPLNLFVPLYRLQAEIGLPGRANVILVGGRGRDSISTGELNRSLLKRWRIEDADLTVRELPGRRRFELRTDRVFLDDSTARAARKAIPGAEGVLTYFVSEIRHGDRATPYSTVTAMEGPFFPRGMRDDEIVIHRWLADDLGARDGDSLDLTYAVLGPRRTLVDRTSRFRVRSVIPMTDPAVDPTLMPEFPGLANRENCRDWEPGIPIDLNRIRDKDEAYWDRYRGSPKAFVTLRAGRRIWGNRFGSLTAVRYAARPGQSAESIGICVRQALNPATMGLFFTPVREQAIIAGSRSMNFGALFLGFSIFLVFSSLLLSALLFAFSVERRREETGLLLAVGATPKLVRRLLLAEGGIVALAAAIVGSMAGALYARAVLAGLEGIWSGAVAGSGLTFHINAQTPVIGGAAGFLSSLVAVWFVLRGQIRAPARILLAPGAADDVTPTGSNRWKFGAMTAVGMGCAAIALVAWAGAKGEGAAGAFFGAGVLFLLAGWIACRSLLVAWGGVEEGSALTIGSLSRRNVVRRRDRGLAVIALLACGSFLIIAVGANRHDPRRHAGERSSGTAGYSLFATTTLPVYHDLNRREGREAHGLSDDELRGVNFLPLRLREGDDASCLNLNRAQTPRLLGVDPRALERRGAFTFTRVVDASSREGREAVASPWRLLERTERDGAIPVVGDVNTVVWSLSRSPGDALDITDERGNRVKLRIVGLIANSILQGSLVMAERRFVERFPGEGGYRMFLIDAPHPAAASRMLSLALEDLGFDSTPAADRLAEFAAVEDTYLSIFAALGGLGLLLGSAGMGVVVLRNVLDRRSELGLLRAIGFPTVLLRWLLFSEHAFLLVMGLAIGSLSAIAAVWPSIATPGTEIPAKSLGLTLLAVGLSGVGWAWLAATAALRGSLLSALRDE